MEPTANAYLEQEVLSATPAKLRWLLLRKAVNLCDIVTQMWRDGDLTVADQWSLRIREILSELLGGIHGNDSVARQVADLYIFLIALQTKAELGRDISLMMQLQELLAIECETWELMQRNLSGQKSESALSPTTIQTPKLFTPPPLASWSGHESGDSSLCIDA